MDRAAFPTPLPLNNDPDTSLSAASDATDGNPKTGNIPECSDVSSKVDGNGAKVEVVTDVMESGKQRAEDMRLERGDEATDLAKNVYHVEWVMCKGRRVTIVTQNINGPCPLLLKEEVVLDLSGDVVTSSQLMGYLGDILLHAMSNTVY